LKFEVLTAISQLESSANYSDTSVYSSVTDTNTEHLILK